jgi:hypothetical protein
MERSLDFLGFPDYSINTLGQLKNIKKNKFVGGSKSVDGYLRVLLSNNIQKKIYMIHRLVALAFLENPSNYLEVDHINRNILDNKLENLRWANRFIQRINTGCKKNNPTGHKHITIEGKYYRVLIIRNYKTILKTKFKSLEDAITARNNCLKQLDEF